jgi:outer membrane protein OmpA-like peptidoglycan-associated protein
LERPSDGFEVSGSVSRYELTLRGKLTLAILAVIMLTAIYSAYAFLGQAENSPPGVPPEATDPGPSEPGSNDDDLIPSLPPSEPASDIPSEPDAPEGPDGSEGSDDVPSSPDIPAVPEPPPIQNVPDTPNPPDDASSAPSVSGKVPQTKLSVYFMPGDISLSDMAMADLQNFTRLVSDFQNVAILVEGSALPYEYAGEPEELADRRVRAIGDYLGSLGVPADRIISTTFLTPSSAFSGAVLSYTGRNGK